MRSITEFDSPAVSEYLVGQGLVRVDKERLKESAIIIKLSLTKEWNGNAEFYKLSLILKSPIMRRTFSIFTSVSLRYFKAVWEESE